MAASQQCSEKTSDVLQTQPLSLPFHWLIIILGQKMYGIKPTKKGQNFARKLFVFYKTTTDLQVQIWFVSSLHRAEYFFEIST